MWEDLLKLIFYAALAVGAYFFANAVTKRLTGKPIHAHVLDCLPGVKQKITEWCSSAAKGAVVHLRLLADEGKVSGKRTLRAIGWADPKREQEQVTITEEVITLEQALALGFDLAKTADQEVVYMVA
jgi:hypothetical protein